MRTLRKATALAAMTSSTLVGLGMAPGVQAAPTPTAAATTASSMPGTSCNEASRFFQLRADGTELWYASMTQANTDNPSVYSWTKIYDIPGGKGESIAAHSSTPDSKGVHLVLSDEHGALRTLNYNKAEGKITLDRTIAPGTATNPGTYRYTSLTSDGDKLYGIKGGKIHVMTSITADAAPKGRATVSGVSGMWPRSFYGNPAGDFDLAWTNSDGRLVYQDIRNTGTSWQVTKSNEVQSSGYDSKAITSPGGGILMRSDGTNLLRYQSTEKDATGRQTIKTAWNVNNSYPMTTVPDVCKGDGSSSSSVGQKIVDKAQSQVETLEGPQADKYFAWAWPSWRTNSVPWCAAFTSWVANNQLGLTKFKSAAVGDWVSAARAKQHGLTEVTSPRPGDFIAFDWDGGNNYYGSSHIGIVKSVNSDGSVNTIEGNSSKQPQGVWNLKRTKSSAENVTFLRISS